MKRFYDRYHVDLEILLGFIACWVFVALIAVATHA